MSKCTDQVLAIANSAEFNGWLSQRHPNAAETEQSDREDESHE